MNCYRLAAHFASRSCDGLVKRFGLSSFNLSPATLLILFLLHQHQRNADADLIPPGDVLFFFSTALVRHRAIPRG